MAKISTRMVLSRGVSIFFHGEGGGLDGWPLFVVLFFQTGGQCFFYKGGHCFFKRGLFF